jgi:outer membrane protein
MKILPALLLAAALAAPGPALAQPRGASGSELQSALDRSAERRPTPLGLDEALRRSLRDNLGLLVKLRELEAASFRAKAAIAPWIPVLSAGGNLIPSRSRRFSNEFQRWNILGGSVGQYNIGLALASPVGTRFSVGWDQRRSDFNLRWELEDGDLLGAVLTDQEFKTREANISLSLNQSLLKGLDPAFNMNLLRQAELAVDAATIQQEKEIGTVLGDALKAYWDLVAARQSLTIAQESRALAEDQREVTAARIAAGDQAPIELLRIDETTATRSSEVLEALRAVEEADGRLKMVLGVALDDDLAYAEIIPTDGVSFAIPERTRDGSLQVALTQNPDLRLAQSQLEGRELQWRVDKHGRLPTLDLAASLKVTGTGNDDPEAIRNLTSGGFLEGVVGLQFSAPLPDVGAWNSARASGAEVEASLLQLQLAERQVLTGIQAALLSIRSFDKQIEVETVRIDLATRTAEAAEATYAVGRNTLRDVLEAQQALKTAQQAKIRAELQSLKARVDLEILRGTLLETLGVELQ